MDKGGILKTKEQIMKEFGSICMLCKNVGIVENKTMVNVEVVKQFLSDVIDAQLQPVGEEIKSYLKEIELRNIDLINKSIDDRLGTSKVDVGKMEQFVKICDILYLTPDGLLIPKSQIKEFAKAIADHLNNGGVE